MGFAMVSRFNEMKRYEYEYDMIYDIYIYIHPRRFPVTLFVFSAKLPLKEVS